MHVLITGGSGFIGSHLAEFLLKNTKHEITVLDKLNSSFSARRMNYLLKTYPKLDYLKFDLQQELDTRITIVNKRLEGVDMVIHMAASSHVDLSIKDPSLTVMDNIVGTCNLLNWMKTIPKIKLIHISTDEVFGSALNDYYAFKENDSLYPENPYAASKVGAEALVRAYACTYKLESMIVRFTNIIGIRQHPEKFIPKVISKIMKDEQILIHTDSSLNKDGSRYYLHVNDAIDGLLMLIRHFNKYSILSKENRFEGIYHLSGNQEISNSTVVSLIANLIGKTPDIKRASYTDDRPYHDLSYRINDTRMRMLGWDPQLNIVTSLQEIVQWSLENPEWLGF